jgi:hypothetical protein
VGAGLDLSAFAFSIFAAVAAAVAAARLGLPFMGELFKLGTVSSGPALLAGEDGVLGCDAASVPSSVLVAKAATARA